MCAAMPFHYFVDPAFRNFGIVVYDSDTDTFREAINFMPDEEYDARKKAGVTEADIWHLQALASFLNSLYRRFPTKDVHIEAPAGAKSSRAMKTMGSVLGVLIGWTETNGIVLHRYSRAEAKRAILGVIGASMKGSGKKWSKSVLKELVRERVTRRWKQIRLICTFRNKNESEHICDAVGIIFAARLKGNL